MQRQAELQSIIKSQESKIYSLKQELQLISQRNDQRAVEIKAACEVQLDDKQKVIEFLQSQLAHERLYMNDEFSLTASRYVREKQNLGQDVERYRAKCHELENRLQKVAQNYELKQKQLQQQLTMAEQKNRQISINQSSLSDKLDKANRFYSSASQQLPRRKETLSLADKVLETLSHSSAAHEQHTKELYSFVNNSLHTVRTDIFKAVDAQQESDMFVNGQKTAIQAALHELRQILSEHQKELGAEHEEFWQRMKQLKIEGESQNTKKMQDQINSLTHQIDSTQAAYTLRLKQLESERKSLMLGFSDLKNLNESREKTYREEIAILKGTIEDLLKNGEDREKELEEIIKALSSQIQNLSARYYDQIELPLSRIYQKVDVELKNASSELHKLQDNKIFVKCVQSLENTLHRYLQDSSQSAMDSLISKHLKTILPLMDEMSQILALELESSSYDETVNVFTDQAELTQVQYKLNEMQGKKDKDETAYEMSMLKRHNAKLKKHCEELQSKAKTNRKPPQKEEAETKSVLMETENYQLKEKNKLLELEYIYQVNLLKDRLAKATGKKIRDRKGLKIISEEILPKIEQTNEFFVAYIERTSSHYEQLKKNLKTVTNMLIRPVQAFQQLAAQLTTSRSEQVAPASTYRSHSSNLDYEAIKNGYSLILAKRQQISNNSTRLIYELVKTLRENQPKGVKDFSQDRGGKLVIEDTKKANKNNLIFLEKRVKQIHQIQIKNKQLLYSKLQKIEQYLKKIDTKQSKKQLIARLQECLQKKIAELTDRINKQSENNYSQLTGNIIKELKNKLKESLIESEGLLKQIDLLRSTKPRVK